MSVSYSLLTHQRYTYFFKDQNIWWMLLLFGWQGFKVPGFQSFSVQRFAFNVQGCQSFKVLTQRAAEF